MAKTLYPPQVNTFMPAFVYTSPAVVYYSVSPYNDNKMIKGVHVTLVDASTNQNALDNPNGVLYYQGLEFDEKVGLYKVEISPNKLFSDKEGVVPHYKINQFYKVQLRFDTYGCSVENGYVSAQDLIKHRADFSEWSSVCLIRAIYEPSLFLQVFSENDMPGFNKGVIPVIGSLNFTNTIEEYNDAETDYLESYQIQILDSADRTVYVDSGNRYASGASNEINYRMDIAGLAVDSGTKLILKVSYVTKNQYVSSEEFSFQIVEYIEDEAFNPLIKTIENIDNGSVTVSVKNSESVFGILHIKRSSNHTHYREWETVYSKKVAGPIDVEIVDNTVASTDWYRYSAQLENLKGGLSPLYKTDKIILDFHDAILSRGSRQFAIRFNYQISSFKPVVNRAKIDTLGGKYPKFAENAQMNYKQFSVTGLISAQADFTEAFLAKTDFFNAPELRTYDIYNYENNISENYDYLWEREFREEAIKWLNDGKPKLYRSQTEGNLVVMVTDVNLTPNKILSRRLWDFSATIYEIEDGYDMRVLDEFGIYDIHADGKGGDGESWGENSDLNLPNGDDESMYVYRENVGQKYYQSITLPETNVVDDIIGEEIRNKYTGVIASKIPSDFSIRNVKIFFLSKPHIYITNDSGYLKINDGMTFGEVPKNPHTIYGYRIKVNDEDVFVNEYGYYQIPNDIKVKSITFPDCDITPEKITIEYIVSYREESDYAKVVRSMSIDKTIVGQISGPFEPYNYLLNNITNKYAYQSTTFFTTLHSLRGLCVDVQPYSVLKVKYVGDDSYNDYLVGMGGVLHLLDDGYTVKDFCFAGRKMIYYDEEDLRDDYYLEPWEYTIDKENRGYSSTRDIEYPIVNKVYRVNSDKYNKIFGYDHKWYNFVLEDDNTGIAEFPIDGVVNYYCDVLRGEY